MKTISIAHPIGLHNEVVLKLEGFLSSSGEIKHLMPSPRTAGKRPSEGGGCMTDDSSNCRAGHDGQTRWAFQRCHSTRSFTPGTPRAFTFFQDARQNLRTGEVRCVVELTWPTGFALGRNLGLSYPGSNRLIQHR